MKILFLDIDGVLNCKTTSQRHQGFIGIDPYMALLVDRICQATGAQIVLSSNWRLWEESRKEVKRFADFIDVTPKLEGIRGDEIEAWLALHPEVETYAILDDDSDFHPHQPLFKTSWETGLTEEISKQVIGFLLSNPPQNDRESKVPEINRDTEENGKLPLKKRTLQNTKTRARQDELS